MIAHGAVEEEELGKRTATNSSDDGDALTVGSRPSRCVGGAQGTSSAERAESADVDDDEDEHTAKHVRKDTSDGDGDGDGDGNGDGNDHIDAADQTSADEFEPRRRGICVDKTSVLTRSSRAASLESAASSSANHAHAPPHDRRRARSIKLTSPEERTGFARIYFENQNFTSSTVFKLTALTTVLEVRKSMANKIKITDADFEFFVIVMVFPGDGGSLSARTLRDDEVLLPLVEKLQRRRNSIQDLEDAAAGGRAKPRQRARPPVKFILKDVRGTPFDLEEENRRKTESTSPKIIFPAFLGRGVHHGYLQKASVKDPNVWRKRWFVIKDDQLLYCKSETDQRDVTAISLLNSYLAKARPEVRVPFSFELRTPRRTYQLCTHSKEDMVGWIQALHVQIGISTENHRLYEAEILITEDAVARNENHVNYSSNPKPSLLEYVLARDDMLKLFRDYVYSINAESLLETWIECEQFRQNCMEREQTLSGRAHTSRSAKEEWDHLKTILLAIEGLPIFHPEEIKQFQQSFQSEQINRRLSIALHSDGNLEYPRTELVLPIHQKIYRALEFGPFRSFVGDHGYRSLLERLIGRVF